MEPLVSGPRGAGRFAVRRGVLHIDGAPRFLWSADYPYYRDEPSHWADRLAKLREAGIQVVTCYVPWRHHAPQDPLRGGIVDFDGSTQGNRDVKGFLRLAHEHGLLAMVKPGPFVHAELRYGGLPDYVDPDLNPRIEPEMTGTGALFRWIVSRDQAAANHSLPAPLDPAFVEYVRGWLQAVTREVIAPNTWPRGPIVALQLLNEGIYCDASNGIIPN
ncbi:MAG: beta-galactosidase, partial [Halobacteriales archaeon]|nr:beta-galactosidase [Halobacteriales archaeon]